MKAIQDAMKPLSNTTHQSFEVLRNEILEDKEIVDFILKHQLTPKEIDKSLPKFNQFLKERQKFQLQDASYIAKGYEPILTMNEGYADVAYLETKDLVDARTAQEIKNRITLLGLPHSLKNIRATDIDLEDQNRIALFTEINDYIRDFDNKKQKGLYIYGNFGVGKSYLMAYLANRLSQKYQKRVLLLHFPTFSVDIKDAITTKSVKDKIEQIKHSEILILDDIGAEQPSSWLRDDILQVILQYRMQENLLTFFTSNFDLEGLERHFAELKSGDETWQAKRIMERIQYLAKSLHLEGRNRRQGY